MGGPSPFAPSNKTLSLRLYTPDHSLIWIVDKCIPMQVHSINTQFAIPSTSSNDGMVNLWPPGCEHQVLKRDVNGNTGDDGQGPGGA